MGAGTVGFSFLLRSCEYLCHNGSSKLLWKHAEFRTSLMEEGDGVGPRTLTRPEVWGDGRCGALRLHLESSKNDIEWCTRSLARHPTQTLCPVSALVDLYRLHHEKDRQAPNPEEPVFWAGTTDGYFTQPGAGKSQPQR